MRHSLVEAFALTSPTDAPDVEPSDLEAAGFDVQGGSADAQAQGAPSIDVIGAAELETLDAPELEPAPGGALFHAGDLTSSDLQDLILRKLDADKAEDIVVIDLQGKSPLADAVVVASGRSQRHVAAIAEHLQRALKDAGLGRAPTEGLPHADWVLIDAGDVIVHLFRPEVRAFYQIEKVWSVDSPHRTASA